MPTATELKTGNYFIYNNEPVRVLRKEVVAFGTHSHSKLKIFFQGLNDRAERFANFQHTDKVDIVEITRKLGQVVSKASDKIQIMDMVSYETFYANANTELFDQLTESDNVTFIDLNGNIQIIEKR